MKQIKPLLFLVLLLGLGGLFLWYFFLFDPAVAKTPFLVCPIRKHTGLLCLSCGGQRALHDLIHFRWIEAFRHNAFLVLGTPLWVYLGYRMFCQYILGKRLPNAFIDKPWFLYALGILGLIFLVLRNLLGWE